VIIGFTGTRSGMTAYQQAEVRDLLAHGWSEIILPATMVHHGDCVGADAEFHTIARGLGVAIVIHPPTDAKLRAFCTGAFEVRERKPYLERNKAIVEQTAFLIAAPKEPNEPRAGRGQGTWSTVRYARALGRPHIVIPPRRVSPV
jgi:hypothetical protein